ncbi:kinesin-like protein KIF9 [Astyanax mexicanus]|uniref:kinesin-like protein KIF9 n=1 Tax=Astyanax mexicanus TaxID=7994 RepID=UPI0020CB47AF|nr:kinesin-like protein KIF9 [Astyanax mexicanus]XP_022533796.2 kinesin-like protein KIF9 [Astyanax mexicanus]
MSAHSSEVKVFVRTRPTACFAQDLIEYLPDKQTVNVRHRRESRKGVVNNQMSSWSFKLDGVMHNMSQEEVYQSVAHSVVLRALEGYNGTIMCFGQTGAGKTYTMTGATESYQQRGIIPRALQEVFYEVEQRVDHTFSVFLSFLEIYNETLVDLLASIKRGRAVQGGALTIVEDPGGGVSVKGLTLHPVHNEEEAFNLLFEGEMNRIIGEHALNKNSSRSHCIFTIHIESRSRTLSDAPYVTSKLNLVDLAGSERLSKTGSEGQVQREALYINRSLSFLEQAIIALTDRRREHVPFRQSKLTHSLKDSLGGNCNTVLVANIYGEAAQIEETLSTLRFATRMKCVRTQPSINEHIDPALQVRRLQKEIQLLKQELSLHDTLANRAVVPNESLSDRQVDEIKSQVQRYLAGTLDEIMIVSIRQIQEMFTQFKKAVQEQEQKVKEQLSQKYSLVEKSENSIQSSTAAAAKEPVGAVGSVGEVESGFGLGLAAPSQKHTQASSPNKSKGKKIKENSRKDVAQTSGPAEGVTVNQRETDALTPNCEPEDLEAPPVDQEEHKKKIDSPPCKFEAFEDFKLGRGSEINRILKENKSVLLERMDQLHKLTQAINSCKRDIDHMSSELQLCREQRQSQGQFVGEKGEPVLEEAELILLVGLREKKDQYRQSYEELLSTKAEVRYCQHLVDQCRIRLLTEFESWYNESFLLPEEVQTIFSEGGPIRPGLIPVDKALNLEADEQEQFQRLRTELLAEGPSAVSFYNAHNRTVQRRQQANSSQS